MDELLDEQFGRVEKALSTLVDSIAAYNPSTQAAIDLVAADDDLSDGLDQLARHQTNYLRIQSLRAEADTLEEQLKTSVKKLAELRHELFETPVATFPDDSRPVPFDELLQYATNISRYTVPPTYRERLPAMDKDREEEDAASNGALTNGVDTPAVMPEAMEAPKHDSEGEKVGEKADGVPEITAEEEEWLKKLKASNLAWYPWPSNDKIRAGILYSLQYWQEKGENLDEFDIPAHLERERLRLLSDKEGPLEQGGPGVSPGQVMHDAPASAPAPAPAPARPSRPLGVFGGLDDMDDDDK